MDHVRDLTWGIAWNVPRPDSSTVSELYRIITLYTSQNSLANYGALTKYVPVAHYQPSVRHNLGPLKKAKRLALERIAGSTNVYYPATNGGWGYLDWIQEVLETAVEQGIFEKEAVDTALKTLLASASASLEQYRSRYQ